MATLTPTKTIQLPYDEYPLIMPMHQSKARFRIMACGRRGGKSTALLREGLGMSDHIRLTQQRQARGIVVAPTYEMVEENWLMARQQWDLLQPRLHEADHWIDLSHVGFGRIDFKSTASEGGVGRGAGYDWAILDEAARIPQDAWESDLRPALADRQGRALFGSTPVGQNWFYDLWRKGQGEDHDPMYQSWRYSTLEMWRSRHAAYGEQVQLAACEQEWQDIVRTTPTRKLQQEYLAVFLENEGVLWSLTKCLRGQLRAAVPGRSYVAGVDVARAEDWMAVAVVEVETRELVALHRSQHRNWDMQKATMLQVLRQYPRCQVLVDSTGVGSPIAHDFRNAGCNVEDIVFSVKTKKNLVDNLGVAIDHGLIGLPTQPETEWLLDELRAFQETKLPSGNMRWSAPEGKHDDGVTALMLAIWALRFDLHQPIEVWQPEEHPVSGFNPDELMAYSAHVRAWRQAYPSIPAPTHPHALAWKSRNEWRQRVHAA